MIRFASSPIENQDGSGKEIYGLRIIVIYRNRLCSRHLITIDSETLLIDCAKMHQSILHTW